MPRQPLSEERKQQLREQLAKAREAKAAKQAPVEPKAEEAPAERRFEDLSLEEKVLYHYQHAQGSIQDIARVYKLEVDEVLRIVGEDEIATVQVQGDLIDQSEAGRNTEMYYGKEFKIPFTVD